MHFQQIYIYKCEDQERGFGLFTNSRIPEGTFIAEYKGVYTTGIVSNYSISIPPRRFVDGESVFSYARFANCSWKNNCKLVTNKNRLYLKSVKTIECELYLCS